MQRLHTHTHTHTGLLKASSDLLRHVCSSVIRMDVYGVYVYDTHFILLKTTVLLILGYYYFKLVTIVTLSASVHLSVN